MTPLIIPYPQIDPVLVQLGPFAIRWYALAYIAGLVIGWRIMRRVCQQRPRLLTPEKIDDFLLWAALGVILGGRLGYVLFYKPSYFVQNRLQVFTLWEGGMSFHGGAPGRDLRDPALRAAQRRLALHAVGPGGDRGTDRFVLRPAGQLHQWRAMGPRRRRALGHGLPARRPAAAPSEPALSGGVRRRSAVLAGLCGLEAHRRTAAARVC